MIRIGIVGSDNSHALAFAQVFNLKDEKTGEYLFPGFEVSCIYGHDEAVTRERAVNGNIKNIVKSPEEMLGNVDAVIVVFRHGDIHMKYALPFLKAGIPTFLDKPFTVKIDDAKTLLEAAEKSGAPLTGGSTLKYAADFVDIRNYLDQKDITRTGIDNFVTAKVSYTLSLAPEYGGIHFYGPHTVEPALFLFGYDVRTVYASRMDKNILAILKYDRYQIVLNFMYLGGDLHINIMEKDGQLNRVVNDDNSYKKGMINFVEVIRKGRSDLSCEQILMPVVVLNAVEQSIVKGREICIKDLV